MPIQILVLPKLWDTEILYMPYEGVIWEVICWPLLYVASRWEHRICGKHIVSFSDAWLARSIFSVNTPNAFQPLKVQHSF